MNSEDIKTIIELLPLLIPVILVQFGLQIYAIVNLMKRTQVRFNSKPLWAAIIIFGGILGTIGYLIFKGEE